MPPDSPRTARSKPAWPQLAPDELRRRPAARRRCRWPVRRAPRTRPGVVMGVPPAGGSRWDGRAASPPPGRSRPAARFSCCRRPGPPARPRSAPALGPGAPGAHRAAAATPIRSRRMSAGRNVRVEQALVVERRAEDRRAFRGDDLGAAPERDRLVDPDPIAEHHEGRRQLGVGPHEHPPRGRRPRPTSLVAARSRPGDDDTLMRIWAPSSARICGTVQVPEVLAHADPDADPEPRGRGSQRVARREEPPLVEQPVGRQEQFPMDVANLAVLQEGRRDEQPVVARLLDEGHDRGEAAVAAASSARRGSSRRIATSAARSCSR